jgi:hypothetical protein
MQLCKKFLDHDWTHVAYDYEKGLVLAVQCHACGLRVPPSEVLAAQVQLELAQLKPEHMERLRALVETFKNTAAHAAENEYDPELVTWCAGELSNMLDSIDGEVRANAKLRGAGGEG